MSKDDLLTPLSKLRDESAAGAKSAGGSPFPLDTDRIYSGEGLQMKLNSF